MVDLGQLGLGGLLSVAGAAFAYNAWTLYGQYTTVTAAADDEDRSGERTVHGLVEVEEPATTETLPEEITDDSDTSKPALWAWRVRRRKKRRRGSNTGTRTKWVTEDAGLSVGEFAIKQDGERVAVDGGWVEENQDGPLWGSYDPFESSHLHLGDPEEDVPIGEGGLLSDLPVTISIGGGTTDRDRFQSTMIREGDRALVHGERAEEPNGSVVRGSEEIPLVIATGSLEEASDRLRSKALKQGAIGGVVLVIGIGLLVVAVTGIV
jgi:hypothetical protein